MQNIAAKSDMQIKVNGAYQTFTYNSSSKQFTANVTLKTGTKNTIEVLASTNCGSVSKTITVISSAPIKPIIRINNPAKDSTNTKSVQMKIEGEVEKISSVSQFYRKRRDFFIQKCDELLVCLRLFLLKHITIN